MVVRAIVGKRVAIPLLFLVIPHLEQTAVYMALILGQVMRKTIR